MSNIEVQNVEDEVEDDEEEFEEEFEEDELDDFGLRRIRDGFFKNIEGGISEDYLYLESIIWDIKRKDNWKTKIFDQKIMNKWEQEAIKKKNTY